jgi:hypothetical protein
LGFAVNVVFQHPVKVGTEQRRFVDCYKAAEKTVHEVKAGYVSLSSHVKAQIAADVKLLKEQNLVKNAMWYFYRSPSGRGGPSKALLKELIRNGINVKIQK